MEKTSDVIWNEKEDSEVWNRIWDMLFHDYPCLGDWNCLTPRFRFKKIWDGRKLFHECPYKDKCRVFMFEKKRKGFDGGDYM